MSMIRSALPRVSRTLRPVNVAALHTSMVRSKTVTETVKETAANLNKKVGETLASGLEKGEQATANAKETVAQNTPTEGQIRGKAEELKTDANKALGDAAGKAREVKDEAANKAHS